MRITLKIDFDKEARLALAHYFGLENPSSRQDIINRCLQLIDTDFQVLINEYNNHKGKEKDKYGFDDEND